ncbi:hypothetical protein TRFO_37110 [Tritrichomonas foetus]|uniref:Uncharacterized protein n=1 Tax=Tritrichomonas foetus TaxID=1144522 RepID=A0A1J4JBY8_9EUKA|nr:hypothetical protein TRFO_37110 [Tritrichomonas foetus]|eukprot:OHS96702.1 hypothetical protein TRFO_37110 [Tritrichomonas foetus]
MIPDDGLKSIDLNETVNSEPKHTVIFNKPNNDHEKEFYFLINQTKVYQISLENLKSPQHIHVIMGLASLINLLHFSNDDALLQELTQADFLAFLWTKITSDLVHPSERKFALLFIRDLMEKCPPLIENFIQSNNHQFLINILPDYSASKVLKICILNSESLRAFLIESQFIKFVLSQLKAKKVKQLCYFRSSNYENNYLRLLLALQPYVYFDEKDKRSFLLAFKRNFSSKTPDTRYAQHKYIKFLLLSNDIEFVHAFISMNMIEFLMKNFFVPAFTLERCNVIQYFSKIASISEKHASYFLTLPIEDFLVICLNTVEKVSSVVLDFIFHICKASYQICNELMTENLFNNIVFNFGMSNYELKLKTYHFFVFLLVTYPDAPFIGYFNESTIEKFLLFGDECLEGETHRAIIVKMLAILLTQSEAVFNKNLIVAVKAHVLLSDFHEILEKAMNVNEDDERFMESANLLLDEIEKLQCE